MSLGKGDRKQMCESIRISIGDPSLTKTAQALFCQKTDISIYPQWLPISISINTDRLGTNWGVGAYFNKSNKQELSMTIKQAYLLSWASSIQLKVYTACCFIFWLWRRHGWQALDVPAKDDDGGDCDNNAKDEQLCLEQEVFANKIVLQFSSFSENLMQSLCQMSTLCHCLLLSPLLSE